MAKNQTIAALDIGSSKITTLIAQLTVAPMSYETEISVVGVSSVPSKGVKKGQIVNIEEAVESIISSVEAAERMAGFNIESAYISVSGAHIASQNSTGVVAVGDPHGEVTSGDVARVLQAARAITVSATRQIIHVIPREYVVDGERGVRDPVGMSGVRLEVDTHLVTASVAALKNVTKAVNEVGVRINDTVFSGIASADSTLSETEKELGCVLVDIGAGTTSVSAYVDGSISYTGALPVGARNVTNDLAIGLRVSLDTAENLKLSLGGKMAKIDRDSKNDQIDITETGSSEVKKVARRTLTEGIVRPRLNEIFSLTKQELDHAGILHKIPSGVVLTGGGSLTVGAEEAARKIFSLPVRLGTPAGVVGLVDDIISPEYATSVGLLLYAAKSGETDKDVGGAVSKMKLPNGKLFSRLMSSIRELLP